MRSQRPRSRVFRSVCSALLLMYPGLAAATDLELSASEPLTGMADASGLKSLIAKDDLYPWTTPDRLDVRAWRTTDEYVHVQVREIHKGDDGADANTQPTVAFFRVDRKSGEWEVEWPAPGEGWVPYNLYRSILKEGLDHRWAAHEDPYGAVVLWDQQGKIVPRLLIFRGGNLIYTYEQRHLKAGLGMGPFVDLVYEDLADRSGKTQPKPFDDVLGNGLPDLVINESVTGGTAGLYENMLTILSLDGTNTVETPVVPCFGEVFYFKDFDNDGCLEIVNTDWEQGFRKFNSGVPMHKGVWMYDRQAGRYRETGTENPDPPDTWPAYREKEQAATPPSAR